MIHTAGHSSGAEVQKCSVCGCQLKRKNYSAHMKRVHAEETSDAGRGLAGSNKGKRAEARKLALARRRRTRGIAIVASVLLVALAGAAVYLASGEEAPAPAPLQKPPPQSATTVNIPVSDLGSSVKFYSYSSGGTAIRYFAAMGSDGNVHVALDACDVCYSSKKGYRQSGEVMTCNNCGKEFVINSIGTENVAGGCWPSYMPVSISGGDIAIKISDLDAKRFMFT